MQRTLPPMRLLRLGGQQLWLHPLQTLLMFVGLALGVAVILGVDLASSSALKSFEVSSQMIAGQTTHQIVSEKGRVPDTLYLWLRHELGLEQVAPVVVGEVKWQEQTIQLLGVDPFAESAFRDYFQTPTGAHSNHGYGYFLARSGYVMVGADWAKRVGIRSGSQLSIQTPLGQRQVTIGGLLVPGDPMQQEAMARMWVCDIATAQELLGVTALSRIDLRLDSSTAYQSVIPRIKAKLPSGIKLVEPSRRQETLRQMSHAFELNLRALSFLALLVGMFLIYNTITFSVVRRRPVLAILRNLGATRSQIFMAVQIETILLSSVAGLVGLGLGLFLAQSLLQLVVQTLNDHYISLNHSQLFISPWEMGKAWVSGVIAASFAALIPAWEASYTPPVGSLRRSALDLKFQHFLPWLAGSGLVFGLLGAGVLAWPSRLIELGFVGLTLVMLGLALMVPPLVWGIAHLAGKLNLPWLWRLVLRQQERAISRTGLAVAALMIAVSVIVGIGLMVGSFRQTVSLWMQTILQADIYITHRHNQSLPPALVPQLKQLPGVSQMVLSLVRQVETNGYGNVILNAYSQDLATSTRQYTWKDGPASEFWQHMRQGDILISETLVYHHQLKLKSGLTITLPTAKGPRAFRVRGVYHDYSAERGSLLMALPVYQQAWQDFSVTGSALQLVPGHTPAAMIAKLEHLLPQADQLTIQSNRGLREAALAIFDRTFTITEALRLLTICIAFLGVLATVMALQLERQRELAILRALGLTPGQLQRVVWLETTLLGGLAGLLALPLGYVLSRILISVINVRSFGWTIQFFFQPYVLLQALGVALFAGALAGIYPGIKARRTVIAQGLRVE